MTNYRLRNWLVLGALSGLIVALVAFRTSMLGAADAPERAPGQLDGPGLENMLKSIGAQPTKHEKRLDFSFKAIYKKEEWTLSMSTVLSQDGKSIWVMAWLDELPRSASDVPRTALLRLLAENDRLGNGKFFAYIPGNRRFVLQRVIPNRNMTTASYRGVLQDLGVSVVQSYPQWSVANWKQSPAPGRKVQTIGASETSESKQDPEPKFEAPIRK